MYYNCINHRKGELDDDIKHGVSTHTAIDRACEDLELDENASRAAAYLYELGYAIYSGDQLPGDL